MATTMQRAAKPVDPGQWDCPVVFDQAVFATHGIPAEWYMAMTEHQLVAVLKEVLRAGDRDAAAAMVLEVLNFPANWQDVAVEEVAYNRDFGAIWPIDSELVALVRGQFPGISLNDNAGYWRCYTAILWAATA